MNMRDEILALKQSTRSVILAHNYVVGEIQDVADFCGDSLELSIRAQNLQAGRIIFCGVRFMAETAKLLSPNATVILPHSSAGCPMADMISADDCAQYRADHPDTLLLAYVNSTAPVKAHVDICCTSGNVEKVLNAIDPNKKILFLPDRNLGSNMAAKLGRNGMEMWPGFCPTHEAVNPGMIDRAREAHPGAIVLVHPECRPSVVEKADHALSTGGILRFVRESSEKEFVIGTERGILHRLRQENPNKRFHELDPGMVCPNMKKITLADVLAALKGEREEIILPVELRERALAPILRMLELK